MKKEFSTAWKASKQPRKQRKYLANAPLHLKKKFVSINLSKELRKKYEKRNVPVKKGDTVKIMRGKFKGKQGKVSKVMLKISKLIIENIQIKKQDGSKSDIKMQPSNLQITALELGDKKRDKVLGKKSEAPKAYPGKSSSKISTKGTTSKKEESKTKPKEKKK